MNFKQTIIDFFQTKTDEIFGNENELVLEFAFYLYKKLGNPNHKLRFEVKHTVDFIKQDISTDIISKECYIDLILNLDGVNFAFEFKYHTSKFPDNDEYILKNHVAFDLLRFSYRKDIYRINKLKTSGQINRGFAILLTNTESIYDTKLETKHQDNNYRFRNIIPKEDKGWILKDGKVTPKWITLPNQNLRLSLSEEFSAEWYDHIVSKEKNGTFKYCIVEI